MKSLLTILSFFVLFIKTQNTPQQFLSPGIVTILSHSCHFSNELTEFLQKNNIPYKPIYLEEDLQALDFITKNFGGKVPWVYENGILIGDGKHFMARYPNLKNNKIPKGINLTELDTNRQCLFDKK